MSRKRIPPSPAELIATFFMTAPVVEIEQAVQWATAIVKQRLTMAQPLTAHVARPRSVARQAGTTAGTAGPVAVPAPVAPPAMPVISQPPAPRPPRQRRKRSDAGQPRPSRRRVPPQPSQPPATEALPLGQPRLPQRMRPQMRPQVITEPVVTTANELPDSYVPPGSED